MSKKRYTLGEIITGIEQLWPLEGSAAWDNSGLHIGRLDQPVDRILLAVDAVSGTVNEAIDGEYSLLLSHHPLLFKAVQTLSEHSYHGSIVAPLIKSDCALYAAHTSADVVKTGTSRALSDALGLEKQEPLVPNSEPGTGLGILGQLKKPETLHELAGRLSDLLPITVGGVRVAGDPDAIIETVALCAGAGDSLLDHQLVRTADVFITSDLRHHPASETRELSQFGAGPALIDISHWAAESVWLRTAQKELRHTFPGVIIDISTTNTDPWDFLVIQHES